MKYTTFCWAPSRPRGRLERQLGRYFNWKVISAAAGITWWNFYFRLYPATIKAPQVVDFLGHLLRNLPGKLLVVWDGLPAHRARLVSEFTRAQGGRFAVERLPGVCNALKVIHRWSEPQKLDSQMKVDWTRHRAYRRIGHGTTSELQF